VLTTATADISLHPQGCVVTRIHPAVTQSLEQARENLTGTVRMCGGRRLPLLVDISQCRPLEPEVRHFYTGEVLVKSFVALAMVVEASPFGRTMGNIYLQIARPGIPTKLFASEAAAVTWLRGFLP
jgi:hypothetical protein